MRTMARKCDITGKSSQVGGQYSNRTRATKFNPGPKRRRQANIQKRRIFVPELDKTMSLSVSTSGLKEIKKNGAYQTLKKAGLI